MALSDKTIAALQKIAQRWDWENYKDDDTGAYWTILQALYCKLTWVQEAIHGSVDMEISDIVQDTMDIVEALQSDIKL